MDKKVLYIGLAFIIIAILVLGLNLSTTSNIASGFSNVLVTQNISISSGGSAPLVLNASSSSYFFVIASLNKPANLYLFNQSGYSAWKANVSSNRTGLAEAIMLEGRGVFAVYTNAINATLPPEDVPSATPSYIFNKTGIYPAGKYYFLIDNTNGSVSTNSPITARLIYIPPLTNSSANSGIYASLGAQVQQEVVLGALFFVLFVVGIAVVIYAFLRKPKPTVPNPSLPQKLPTNMDQSYVDSLYKNIEKRKKAKKKKA